MPDKKIEGSLYLIVGAIVLILALGTTSVVRNSESSVFSPRAGADWCTDTGDVACLPMTCRANPVTIILFHAEWCSWCRKLKKETLADPEVIDALQPFGRVIIDIDKNPGLADEYHITGVPGIVFLDAECGELTRISGYVEGKQLLQTLDGLRSKNAP